MPLRTLLLATLGILGIATVPALAAPTDQQKFEKKVERYAQPIAALDFSKPRGLCTCGTDDPAAIEGQTGVLAYGYQSGIGAQILSVSCEIPVFDLAGAIVASQTCEDWTLLSR